MNFFGKGKKGRKSAPQQAEPPAFDFSSPDAFSEENMAKMSGVDTMAFDENDPSLMAELAELGWGEDSSGGGTVTATTAAPPAGHRPPPAAAAAAGPARGRGALAASAPPRREASGNELLRSLGLSLNSLGEPELTEADMQDPDLLGELGEVAGDVDFESAPEIAAAAGGSVKGGGPEVGGYDDDEEVVEPDRPNEEEELNEEDLLAMGDDAADVQEEEPESHVEPKPQSRPALPPRRAPEPARAPVRAPGGADGGGGGPEGSGGGQPTSEKNAEISRLEREHEILQGRALELRKAGDRQGALEAMRAARSADNELRVLRTLETARKVATVRTEYVTPSPAEPEDGDRVEPSPAGAGAGGGGGKPVSAELVMKQVKVLYQRAIELKKEGRTAEAMACLKRAKSLEADLLRDAQGKGLVAAGGGEGGEAGDLSRRPSMLRQGSSRRSSSSSATEPPARRDSRAGPRTSLPPAVKAANKPKVFPAERDLFSDLEDALAAGVQLHVERAKSLVKKDRAAAAKEVKRYKELQAKLDLAREMRVVPGARPPQWQWKITKKSRVRVLEQVAMDEVELEIYRVHGLTDKTDNRGSIWIKFDLGYSKDEKTGKGFTHSYRADADTVDVDFKESCYVKRARSTQMAFQNRRAGLEIFHKKNIVSGGKLIGKCLIPLQPLLTTCELTVSTPILTEGRREAGGRVEMTLRLRKPISSDEVVVTEEKELEVGEWPAVSLDPVAQPPAAAPAAAAPAPAPAAAPSSAAAAASGPGAAATAAAHVQAAARFQSVVLTDTEKSDPFAVENLDSNNVLEAEIEAIAAKAATGDLPSVIRKGALETKLLMLVSAVQSGDLDLPAYCDILRERVVRDKVLAMHLKKEKRTKEAVAVMKRMRTMEEELAGVPQEEEEG